ncbi:hypothetical protein [Adlercreutzia muris]|jgi:hypothetical protein|uniref:hypothetical protein n=1 Tax=Adlercreutzia muris TaxID=1796610 RepID=UPI001F599E43|nr:hypothetical protein [Adlercreutzia muris]
MSVHGMALFHEAFAEFGDSYALIGGSACDLLFSQEGLRFRATKDLDVVLLADRPSRDFGKVMWGFIRRGGYRCGWRNDDEVHFYRFTEPQNPSFPAMIELFARHPAFPLHEEHSTIVPLPLEGDISSLSAILLDDAYFSFLSQGLAKVEGLSVVDAGHLIPLKARAHVDLQDRKRRGEHVNERDLKKHRKDVFRLLAILPAGASVSLHPQIRADMNAFVEDARGSRLRVDQLGLGMGLDEALELLKAFYGLQA